MSGMFPLNSNMLDVLGFQTFRSDNQKPASRADVPFLEYWVK